MKNVQRFLENSNQTVFFIESNVFPLLSVKLKNVLRDNIFSTANYQLFSSAFWQHKGQIWTIDAETAFDLTLSTVIHLI